LCCRASARAGVVDQRVGLGSESHAALGGFRLPVHAADVTSLLAPPPPSGPFRCFHRLEYGHVCVRACVRVRVRSFAFVLALLHMGCFLRAGSPTCACGSLTWTLSSTTERMYDEKERRRDTTDRPSKQASKTQPATQPTNTVPWYVHTYKVT
jgi:hypothetical protein